MSWNNAWIQMRKQHRYVSCKLASASPLGQVMLSLIGKMNNHHENTCLQYDHKIPTKYGKKKEGERVCVR